VRETDWVGRYAEDTVTLIMQGLVYEGRRTKTGFENYKILGSSRQAREAAGREASHRGFIYVERLPYQGEKRRTAFGYAGKKSKGRLQN